MKKLYRLIFALLVKLNYKYVLVAKIRTLVRLIIIRLFIKKNSIAITKLRALIQKARNINQIVFVQFPIMNWDAPFFQRPQQMSLGMSKSGCLVIYFCAQLGKKNSLVKINENLYVTNQLEFLNEIHDSIVSIYLNRPHYIFDKYLTEDFYNKNNVFIEYVDDINDKITGKFFYKILKERFEKLYNPNLKILIATSNILYKELLNKYPEKNILYVPNAVDLNHYTNYPHSPDEDKILDNKLLSAIIEKRKIIGYFGAIAPWIWSELIIELSEKHPEYFIVMIGNFYGETIEFASRDNILLTGSVDYMNLPIYTKYFDASIIPFRLGDIAKGTSPLKLFEYFAIGKPIIVTSDLVECTKFDGVYSASNINEFIIKVEEALEQNSNNELKNKYLKYAHDNSWEERAKVIINYL